MVVEHHVDVIHRRPVVRQRAREGLPALTKRRRDLLPPRNRGGRSAQENRSNASRYEMCRTIKEMHCERDQPEPPLVREYLKHSPCRSIRGYPRLAAAPQPLLAHGLEDGLLDGLEGAGEVVVRLDVVHLAP